MPDSDSTSAVLPTGTVTFLFTDIEGSTQLARGHPDAWPACQARHHAILQAAISEQRGYVFRVIGDEFNAAFATALDALAAALAAQHALHAEDWGPLGALRVRMGLHSGPAALRDGEYEGYLTLSHTKRLMSAAAGGQVLLSEAAEALLRENLPPGASLRSLGEHRLKDFERAERIFQAAAPGLPAEFPPLKSLDGAPNNLPVQLTSFIGRAKELGEVREALASERLLTLTGPGGSGKTRLALQAAAELLADFADGVFFVALAPIREPGLVASTIAQALGLTETPGRSIVDSLKDYVQNKALLLLLDNFEQVIAAAPLVADLLAAGRGLKIMVTSRESLRVSGEQEYPVPALALPDLAQLPSLEALSQYAAVDLFLQRARAVSPDFRITAENARAVAEICYRLDGLPLAIELAAARIRLLPPPAMLARLQHSLEILTGGARDLPARQQTLRNAIAWSYDLLEEAEQRLFRRLAVFVRGFTVEAAEAVAGQPPGEVAVLDGIGSLLNKSLLKETGGLDGEPRFFMLETLREFGLEQLEASSEGSAVRRGHAAFFLALAGQAEANSESAGQVQWTNRMDQEHDNLRAALEWCQAAAGESAETAEMCLSLAAMLGKFWEARGYISEGRERLAAVLRLEPAQAPTLARARLLGRAAELAYRQSDYPATTRFAAESLAIYRAVGDRQGTASALIKLGNAATEGGDYATAEQYLDEALELWRALADKHGTARALISLGWAALRPGEFALAEARLAEALAISRALGDTRHIGFELAGLGEVALRQGDYARAARLVEESLELRRQLGNRWGIGVSLGILGWVALREGNLPRASALLRESLEVRREIGDQGGSAWCIERLAEVAQAQGQPEKAARLFGAGDALRASVSAVMDAADLPEHESTLAALRAEIGPRRFAAAWEEGRALPVEQAVAGALEP